MARKQYRWFGQAKWHSGAGNAVVALINMAGSNKKVIVHSVEAVSRTTSAPLTGSRMDLVVSRAGTIDGGAEQLVVSSDTSATLPSGIKVVKDAGAESTGDIVRTTFAACALFSASSAISQRWSIKSLKEFDASKNSSVVESVVLRPGENLAVFGDHSDISQFTATFPSVFPVQVNGTFVVLGTPNRTFSFSYLAEFGTHGSLVCGIKNGSDSSVVIVKSIRVNDIPTTLTPYFMVVPIGQADAQSVADGAALLTPSPIDSDYGALSTSQVKLIADLPFLPYGVPAEYANQLGAGAPKFSNYLHTKDYVGPTWAVLFPEYRAFYNEFLSTVAPDLRPVSVRVPNTFRLIDPSAPIVLREGEGMALVSAAETFSTSLLTAGWQSVDVGVTFSIDELAYPTISISGMVSGSRYRVERQDTGALVFGGIADGSGAASYEYTVGDTPVGLTLKVRKASSDPRYKPYEVDFTLTSGGASIPVSQIPD